MQPILTGNVSVCPASDHALSPSTAHSPRSAALRILRTLCALVLLTLLGASPVAAQPLSKASPGGSPKSPVDLQVIVISMGWGPDNVAVAYATPETNQQIKQDFADIARELGNAAPKVEVSRKELQGTAIPAANAELTGLTNWQAGTVNLNPLIRVYRRYGHFRINFLFLGKFPLRPLGNFNQPPVRVAERVHGNSVDYEIWVDQSNGVPESVPTLGERGPDQNVLIGIGAIALVIAGSMLLILKVVFNQRRAAQAGEGKS